MGRFVKSENSNSQTGFGAWGFLAKEEACYKECLFPERNSCKWEGNRLGLIGETEQIEAACVLVEGESSQTA